MKFRNILFVIVLIAVLILAVSQGVRLAQGSSRPFSKPASQAASALSSGATPIVLESGWRLYEDPDAGFSIGYPADAHISSSMDAGSKYKTVNIAFIHVGTSGGYQGMVINVLDNPAGLSIEGVVDKIYADDPAKPAMAAIKSSLTSFKTANISGFKTNIRPTNTEIQILVPFKNGTLFLAPVHGPAATAVDPEALSLFYKILDTLHTVP
jgi:hypothetical protein